ncbi:RluA family pseudouridine synthase [Bacillus sp. 2205SS5-2]|uniref:RluA family pseudouridine synthase n=1 Tax=Bacillus sp. 2205SS5-2 TaxID=3109031 RepID=UPI0030040654
MKENYQLSWVVCENDDENILRSFLIEKGISKRALTAIKFSGGKIEVNGEEEDVRYKLKCGDTLSLTFPSEVRSAKLIPEELPLEIIYEDEHLLVVNKPPFMNTIPSREHPSGSLANGLIHYYDKKKINGTIHIVTRLDRNTSGLLLIAKHSYVHSLLGKCQQNGHITRKYEALVQGKLSKPNGIIQAPIGRKDSSIIEREVRQDGQFSCTKYHLLSQFNSYAHVSLTLSTGRTHQIRVHMSYIGHPLLGDDLYGGKKEDIHRQALHSKELTFYHPIFQKELTFTISLPSDMNSLIFK